MSAQLAALLEHISSLGQELSPDAIDRLAGELARLSDWTSMACLSAPTPRERVLLDRLRELWRGVNDFDPVALSLALRVAQRTGADVKARQTVELVWTGPRTEQVPVRRSDQALLEVIDSAESDLLMVSYAVFNVPKIASGLSRALDRGVDVRLVLEFEGAHEADQSYDPLAALGELPEGVRVYHWPFQSRPAIASGRKRGYLHVKCTVADRELVFVSSANLTAYAMEANMELGVLIRGGLVPRRIATHFEHLISQGVLELRD